MNTEVIQRCNVCESKALDAVDPDCHIARCRDCGYIFDNPRPTLDELIGFYSQPSQYDSWLGEFEARQRLWKRRLKALEPTRKTGSLLDVGTGIGQFLAVARDSYAEVYGTEVSSAATQIAKQKYHLDLLQGTIDDLDMRGKVFDNITLFHVLEHVPDPRSVLTKCHSLLAAQGVLAIAVPNEVTSLRAYLRRKLAAGAIKQGRVGKFGLPRISLDQIGAEVHLSHFTPKVLRRLLQTVGFSVVEETLDPYYVLTGLAELRSDIYYYCCLVFRQLFRLNLYDSMLVIARKQNI